MANATTLGLVRAYWLGVVACIGGLLFGYDTGIVGGSLTLPSFKASYGINAQNSTRASSLSVGLQQLGAFVACFFIWPLADRLGRKPSLILCSVVFCIGVIIETVPTHSKPAFYVGRVIAGLGVGASSTIIPMYSGEMAPKEIRGRMGSFYQWMFTWGILISYWVNYAVKNGLSPNQEKQWQVPISLQLVPGAALGLGMLTLPESARWLVKKGRHQQALESLKWIRADDSSAVVDELQMIVEGAEAEKAARRQFNKRQLFERANVYRVFIAIFVFISQQSTGATALAYFGPQFFTILVGSGSPNLLITGVFGAIKVVACGLFIVFLSERVGRRYVMMFGALGMAACMIPTAIVVLTCPPPGNGVVTSAGIATVALIFLNIIIYNCSWGPLPWAYVGEIFPGQTREIGVAVGVSSQWLFNFIYSLTTPYIMDSLDWGTFLLFGAFDICIALFVFFCIRETRSKNLEEMEAVFHTNAARVDKTPYHEGALSDEEKPFTHIETATFGQGAINE